MSTTATKITAATTTTNGAPPPPPPPPPLTLMVLRIIIIIIRDRIVILPCQNSKHFAISKRHKDPFRRTGTMVLLSNAAHRLHRILSSEAAATSVPLLLLLEEDRSSHPMKYSGMLVLPQQHLETASRPRLDISRSNNSHTSHRSSSNHNNNSSSSSEHHRTGHHRFDKPILGTDLCKGRSRQMPERLLCHHCGKQLARALRKSAVWRRRISVHRHRY